MQTRNHFPGTLDMLGATWKLQNIEGVTVVCIINVLQPDALSQIGQVNDIKPEKQ